MTIDIFRIPICLRSWFQKSWIEEVRQKLPELPAAKYKRYVEELAIPAEHAIAFSEEKSVAAFFDRAVAAYPAGAVAIAHIVKGEVLRELKDAPEQIAKLSPEELAGLVRAKEEGKISSSQQKKIFLEMWEKQTPLAALLEREGSQVDDLSVLEPLGRRLGREEPQRSAQAQRGPAKPDGLLRRPGDESDRRQSKAPAGPRPGAKEDIGALVKKFRTIAYASGRLSLLDQTKLPREETYVELTTVEDVARAIETMVVRGAPAIGITAAFGIALAARTAVPLATADARLRKTRPTAVNLFFALDRMAKAAAKDPSPDALEAEARAIYDEDVAASRRIGELGAALIPDGASVLTHCNAGALATGELGPRSRSSAPRTSQGKRSVCMRMRHGPLLQGARLTAWELMRDGIEVTLVPDVALGHLLYEQAIDCAVVGADRIARNGDTANKIGTRTVACLLYTHGRPLYVAAPWSTVDRTIAGGRQIPIEERAAEEVTSIGGVRIAPDGVRVRNPAFDVTPAGWITGIITERGFTGKDVERGLTEQAG